MLETGFIPWSAVFESGKKCLKPVLFPGVPFLSQVKNSGNWLRRVYCLYLYIFCFFCKYSTIQHTYSTHTVVSSRNRRLELTRETAVFEFFQLFNPQRTPWRNCLMSEAPDNETGSWNIPHLAPALLHVVYIRVAVVLCLCVPCPIPSGMLSGPLMSSRKYEPLTFDVQSQIRALDRHKGIVSTQTTTGPVEISVF